MGTFMRCTNEGVTAVVTAAVYDEIQRNNELLAAGTLEKWRAGYFPKPVFTFAKHPTLFHRQAFLTGSLELMDRLLAGQEVQRASFYVPFSNGLMYREGEEGNMERSFRTTLEEAIAAFGLTMFGDKRLGL